MNGRGGPARVAVDARMLGRSGIGVYLRELLARLLCDGRLSFTLLGDPARLEEFRDGGARIVPCRLPVYSARELLLLPRAAPAADVFWSPHFNTPLLPVRAARRVVTVHDCFHLDRLASLPLPQRAYAALLFRMLPRLADTLVTVSRFSRARLARHTGIPGERIELVGNAVDPARFLPDPDADAVRARLAARLGLTRPYLLFVGILKPHKNVARLVEAFALAARALPGHDLVLAGTLEGLLTRDETLPGRIAALRLEDRVRLPGAVAHDLLPDLYRGATAFLFPTLYEGFGIPPLEAMACGTPCMLSTIPPVREVCGDAGLPVDPLDPRAMARAMVRLVRDAPLRADLTARGLARVRRHSWERSAAAMAEILLRGR